MPGVPLPQPKPKPTGSQGPVVSGLCERLQAWLLIQHWARASEESLQQLTELADPGELAAVLHREEAGHVLYRFPALPIPPSPSPQALQEIFLLWIGLRDHSRVLAKAIELLEPDERELLAKDAPSRAHRKFVLFYQGLLYERFA
jgi:hypothetical protein